MAFESLRNTLSREISAQRDFNRGAEDRALDQEAKRVDIAGRKLDVEGLADRAKRMQAQDRASKALLEIDSTPMGQVSNRLTKEHIAYLEAARKLGSPEELRRAENKVKFDVMTRENPQFMDDISTAFPELVQKITGLGEQGKLSEEQAIIKARTEAEKQVIGERGKEERVTDVERHKQRMKEIAAQAAATKRNIELEINKGGTSKERQYDLEIARNTISKLEEELSRPLTEEEIASGDTSRIENIKNRINQWAKYVSAVKDGLNPPLPKFEESKQEDVDIQGGLNSLFFTPESTGAL